MSQLNQTEYYHIDSNKVTLNQVTMMLLQPSTEVRFKILGTEFLNSDIVLKLLLSEA